MPRFYIEAEDIIFESYVVEPELRTPSEMAPESQPVLHDDGIRFRVGSSDASAAKTTAACHEAVLPEAAFPGALPDAAFPGVLPDLGETILVDVGELRRTGVPEYIIEKIRGCRRELSHMRITASGKILLTDYNVEVKMPTLERALYFFYLRHPEGVRFKELGDHSDELMDLYASVSGRSDVDGIRESIAALVDPFSNRINEKCSRIKGAFTKAFGPALAAQYIITGASGEARGIPLDRSLVIWETLR